MPVQTTVLAHPSCTAFLGEQRVAHGSYDDVAQALLSLDLSQGTVLVFDDASGQQVDHPWPAGWAPPPCAGQESIDEDEPRPAGPAGVGRPRLGVVAREVTLLPRHWAWLAQQPGGASAALRRLVEVARKSHAGQDAQRHAKERAYRFMGAMAGALPDFEEATRALFANDAGVFATRIADWPRDVQAHLSWLARGAFDAP